MPFLRTFTHATIRIRPRLVCAIGLGGMFMNPARHSSSSVAYLLRTPPPSAPREVPTPLVFVSASGWDPKSRSGMSASAAWFAERGYTCLEIDLANKPKDGSTSEALMKHYESELASHIRLLEIPFAPVIVARAGGALIAQTYVSSYPASALLLISPPPSNASLDTSPKPLLPTALPEFNFEAKFPCAIMCTEGERAVLEEGSRLWKDEGIDRMVVKDEQAATSQEGLVKIEQWLDELGF